MMSTPKTEYEGGIALLLAIIVVSIILSIGLNLSVVATKELGFVRLSSDSIKAHYAAESVLECAIYWMFQGTQYFSDSTEDIYCNEETIELNNDDGDDIWTISIGEGGSGDEYASAVVEKIGDPSDRSFILASEGFNDDPSLATGPLIIQQELGAVSIEGCEFDPQNADANDNANPITSILSSNLQDTLDTAYGTGSNYIEASSSNSGYQTWKIGNASGTARINLQVTPLESMAGNTNTFGYYVSNTDDPFESWAEIQAANAFIPVFSNKGTNSWGAPSLTPNPDASLDGWKSFTINAQENDVIGLGIHTVGLGGTNFRSTEVLLNGYATMRTNLKIGGECIAPNGSFLNGTRLILESCNGDLDQEWVHEGLYWRNAAEITQVIDMSSSNPTVVQLWAYWSGSTGNQEWSTTEIGTTDRYLFENQKAPGGLCLADTGGLYLTTAICDGGAAGQQIEIEELGTYGYQWALSFDVPEPFADDVPEYVIAFEDFTLSGGSNDTDYDDMVVTMKVVSCISELNRR